MLSELAVRNLGVIDEMRLVLGDGMTALTGETGAGKTLIVDAIGLLSGGRADSTMVREGADEAVVEGRFCDEQRETVVSRVVPRNGRSRAYVDGRMATVSSLGEVIARQVDLHAQHAHQSLTSVTGQRAALDRFAGVDLSALHRARDRVRDLEVEIASIGGDVATRERELELLRFQFDELERARLEDPDEDEDLAAEEATLGDVTAHREGGEQALALLTADGGAVDALGQSVGALEIGEVFASERSRLQGLAEEVADVARAIRSRLEGIDEDPERLAAVVERRQLIAGLRRRFGDGTLAGVIEAHQQLAERISELEGADERAIELDRQLDAARSSVAAEAATVGALRRRVATEFADAVQRELRDLGMPNARFEVTVSATDPGDEIHMRFSANPGSRPASLARIASGGELARVMLAVRLVAISDQDTLVFDEVDAGIGGAAAVSVGTALGRLARDRQVVVVTHLAQVAAAADRQVGVKKLDPRDVDRRADPDPVG